MHDCGFMPPDVQLECQKHETRGCIVATKDKTTVLVTVVAKIAYITHRALMQLSIAFSLQFGWGSILNTSEMFWIDISRWMISKQMLMNKRPTCLGVPPI